jgi:TonB family protein
MSFLTSLLINLIIFSLAFVYIAGGSPAGDIDFEPTPDEPPEAEESTAPVPEPLDIQPPADFVSGTSPEELYEDEFEFPRFKQVFDSYLLPAPYRGNKYVVTVRLEIDTAGHLISEPLIVVSSGEKVVDQETVDRLKRIRFTPLRHTVTGQPIPTILTTKIFWDPGGG